MATDNSERIDRFLKEQMTAEENKAFLHDLEIDEELRKEAQLTALMLQELQERQNKRDAEIIDEVTKAKGNHRKARTARLAMWIGSVAAMMILIFSIYLYLPRQNHENEYTTLANKYYSETPIPNFKSGITDADRELDELFRQVGTADNLAPTINRLETIYGNLDAEYAYQANGNDIRIVWHLALAYLKVNKVNKAIPLLRTIMNDDKGTELGDKAQELLDKIGEP